MKHKEEVLLQMKNTAIDKCSSSEGGECMTTFLTANSTLPPYMAFPSFLLDCDFSETTKLLYMVLLNRARLSQKLTAGLIKRSCVLLFHH